MRSRCPSITARRRLRPRRMASSFQIGAPGDFDEAASGVRIGLGTPAEAPTASRRPRRGKATVRRRSGCEQDTAKPQGVDDESDPGGGVMAHMQAQAIPVKPPGQMFDRSQVAQRGSVPPPEDESEGVDVESLVEGGGAARRGFPLCHERPNGRRLQGDHGERRLGGQNPFENTRHEAGRNQAACACVQVAVNGATLGPETRKLKAQPDVGVQERRAGEE